MKIELKNVKIAGSNFSGRKVSGYYQIGKSFAAVISENDAEKLESLGYPVRTSTPDTKYVRVKIPKFCKTTSKILKPYIHVKIRGINDLVLGYSSAGILDYATIRKANIVVDVHKSEKFNNTVLYLVSMDAYVNKNISIPVSGLLNIIEEHRSQERNNCLDELKNIIDSLKEE